MGRKPKDGKQKSVQELENAYIEKMQHAVASSDKWIDKLIKGARSKKYSLSNKLKVQAVEHLDQRLVALRDAFESTTEEIEEGFTFEK